MTKKRDLYLYLIAHTRSDIKTHTYIGCVKDFYSRLQQHNGQNGPRITKRAAGHWKPIIILKLPGSAEINSKKIKCEWKQSSRGLESRVKKGFFLAQKYNLTCYVTEENDCNIGSLEYLKDKWKDGKAQVDDSDWLKLIHNDV